MEKLDIYASTKYSKNEIVEYAKELYSVNKELRSEVSKQQTEIKS